jgi:hypothetical protein
VRACEFIVEVTNGKITKRQRWGTRGLNKFTPDGPPYSGSYTLNRVMMAVAGSDGKTINPIDASGWSATNTTAHPYTQQEQDMLKLAYSAVGAKYTDLNNGDMRSQEPPGGNIKSPTVSFKGYPR